MALADRALDSVRQGCLSWCHFITANDVGGTGSHQAGFYIPKSAAPRLFDEPSERGRNLLRRVEIVWQGDLTTQSALHYYGTGTRNEHRLTRLGRGFPYLRDECIGDLLVLARQAPDQYEAWVLSQESDIETFLASCNLPPGLGNYIVEAHQTLSPNERLLQLLEQYAGSCSDFPPSAQMSRVARQLVQQTFALPDDAAVTDPDDTLLRWTTAEYDLFRLLERRLYTHLLTHPFASIEAFIGAAQEVLNRRKARAGKSLEHHLADIFERNHLRFDRQPLTELNKRPDFLFPGAHEYHDLSYPAERLIMLGAKTTCKDRWRQVLNEADRARNKFLFTLQPGISSQQLEEMWQSGLSLVVPASHLECFPRPGRDRLVTLRTFVEVAATSQR